MRAWVIKLNWGNMSTYYTGSYKGNKGYQSHLLSNAYLFNSKHKAKVVKKRNCGYCSEAKIVEIEINEVGE